MPRARSPGPGNQNVPAWLKIGVRPEGPGFTGYTEKPYKHPWAQSSSKQHDLLMPDLGDPGAYIGIATEGVHTGNKEAIGSQSRRSFNSNSRKGRAGFNTREPGRPASAPRSSRRDGDPGAYDILPHFETGSALNGAQQTTSVFKSQIPLGGHIRKSDTPGVGTVRAALTSRSC